MLISAANFPASLLKPVSPLKLQVLIIFQPNEISLDIREIQTVLQLSTYVSISHTHTHSQSVYIVSFLCVSSGSVNRLICLQSSSPCW